MHVVRARLVPNSQLPQLDEVGDRSEALQATPARHLGCVAWALLRNIPGQQLSVVIADTQHRPELSRTAAKLCTSQPKPIYCTRCSARSLTSGGLCPIADAVVADRSAFWGLEPATKQPSEALSDLYGHFVEEGSEEVRDSTNTALGHISTCSGCLPAGFLDVGSRTEHQSQDMLRGWATRLVCASVTGVLPPCHMWCTCRCRASRMVHSRCHRPQTRTSTCTRALPSGSLAAAAGKREQMQSCSVTRAAQCHHSCWSSSKTSHGAGRSGIAARDCSHLPSRDGHHRSDWDRLVQVEEVLLCCRLTTDTTSAITGIS